MPDQRKHPHRKTRLQLSEIRVLLECQQHDLANIKALLIGLGEKMDADTLALIKKFDDATSAIAARLQKLIDLAAANGSATEAQIRAALQPDLDKLTALGQDPANPVPTTP